MLYYCFTGTRVQILTQKRRSAEILKHCYLATKSTKLDLAKMGLVDPLPIDVYTIYYIKQILLNDNHLISVHILVALGFRV